MVIRLLPLNKDSSYCSQRFGHAYHEPRVVIRILLNHKVDARKAIQINGASLLHTLLYVKGTRRG